MNQGGQTEARVLRVVAPGQVAVSAVPLLPPGVGEVRVRTLVSAISAGTERLVSSGAAVDSSFGDRHGRSGYSTVGVVEVLGDGVDTSWRGARVFAFQPHASHFVAPVASLILLPEGLSSDAATLLANTETAVSLVMDAAPVLGEVSAVVGLGVVGQLVLAITSRLQLGPVHGVDVRDDRVALARTMSPHARFTAPTEVDVVYEVSGSTKALAAAFDLVRREGRVIAGSWYDGAVSLGTRAHTNRNTVRFSQVSTIDAALAGRFDKVRRMGVALEWLAKLPVEVLVTHRVPFNDASTAWELLTKSPSGCLQILLTHES